MPLFLISLSASGNITHEIETVQHITLRIANCTRLPPEWETASGHVSCFKFPFPSLRSAHQGRITGCHFLGSAVRAGLQAHLLQRTPEKFFMRRVDVNWPAFRIAYGNCFL